MGFSTSRSSWHSVMGNVRSVRRKYMKKTKLLVIILLLVGVFSSCASTNSNSIKNYNRIISVDGVENFDVSDGNYILNYHILPTNDFIDRFKYVDIEYHYREHYESLLDFVGYEKSIIVINYDEKVYESAKDFCLREMELSETYALMYNDFVFIENIELAVGQDSYRDDFVYSFPQKFNMFAYNDELQCLIFLGYYCPDFTNEDAMLTIKNWGEFLENYYSDVYSFD